MPAYQIPKKWALFLGALVVITVFITCRKIEYSNSRDKYKVDRSEEFFKLTSDVNPTVRRVAEAMKRYNKQHEFVNNFVKKHGLPVWNKCPVFMPKRSAHRGADGDPELSGNDTLLFIPIVEKDDKEENRVVSFVAAVATEDTITLRLFNSDEFAGYGMTDRADTLSAETIASTSMWLETIAVENRDTFALLNNDLFHSKSYADDSLRYFIIDTSNASEHGRINKAGILIYELNQYCYTTTIYFPPKKGFKTALRDYETINFCINNPTWEEYVFSNPGMILPPESTGGGGSGYLDNNVDCSSFPQGQCGSYPYIPWVPVTDEDPPSGNYLLWGYHHFETWDVSPEDYGKIQNWRQNNNIDTIGLDSCVRQILDKLIGGDSYIGEILSKMERSITEKNNIERFKIAFRVDTMTDAYGKTLKGRYDANTKVFTDTILLQDSLITHGTELAIARVIVHELIHAYMKSILQRIQSLNLTQLEAIGYDSTFNIYIDTLIAVHNRKQLYGWTSQNPEYAHNFMADIIFQRLVDAIAYVDSYRNSDEYYWCVTWSGLMETNTMKQYYPNYYAIPPAPNWPPTHPAPNDASTNGLKYALTQPRLDSLRRYLPREALGLPLAKGRHKIPGGCY